MIECWACGGAGWTFHPSDDMAGGCDDYGCVCGGCYEQECDACDGEGLRDEEVQP